MFEVLLLDSANIEMAESFDWYEEARPGLGNEFYDEINRYISLIENNPYQFAVKYPGELRAASVTKFPFLIIYWIEAAESMVLITSIFHTSRKPKY